MRLVASLLMTVVLVMAGTGAASADSAASRNNEGNRYFEQKQYDEALRMYTDAQAIRPEAPELHYNIGNVLFRKGEYEKAIGEYRRAEASRDAALAQSAIYNRGNALMLAGQVPDAAKAYVQALRADPSDQDAKRNLELALRLLEEQQQQQQQQGGDQQDGEKDDRQEPQKSPEEQPGDPPADSRQKQPRKGPGQMSEEDARRILEAIREDEREGVRKHAKATAPHRQQPEKDW
ncbi:MAG: tetratricopeptide repeat protein [Acidobacteria bacterium]|nr:tetratricopeptide repeat protein [Acidobacteriota bacterium]